MKYKIIFISILLVILSINCVSAVDNDIDELNANITITDTLDMSDSEIISDTDNTGNFTTLAKEIESTDTEGTLELTKNYTYDSSGDEDYISGITINKAITIDGKGYTISGNNLARILYVNASNVVLKNIVFSEGYLNGTDSYGGAIYWNGDNGNVTNCTFTSNTVKNVAAGAIIWQGNNGTVSDSKFTSNTAKSGGAITWKGTDGKLINSVFASNSASVVSGGAVEWYGDSGYLYNCNFTGNSGNTMGGALYAYSTYINVTTCNFNSNKVAIFVGGGAVYLINVSGNFKNCNFNNNYIYNQFFLYNGKGGALYWVSDYSYEGNIINCTFSGNKGTTGYSIYTNSTLNIYNSTFADQSKVSTIYNNGNLYLENNNLNNYNTIYIADGSVTSPTTVTINASPENAKIGNEVTINGTITDDNGNSIILPNIDLTIDDTVIATATFDTNGIFTGTYKASSEGNLSVSADINNVLTSASIENATLNVTQKDPVFSTIAELLESASEGDTIYLTQNYTYSSTADTNYTTGILIDKQLTIDGQGYTINGNDVARIFNITADNVILRNMTLINGMSSYGGAVYSNTTTTIENCYFVNNTATTNGGAVYSAGGNIYDSIFIENSATNKGGAVYYDERGNVTNCKFISNTAGKSGGAVYFNKKGYAINSTFTNNAATGNNGGALYFEKTGYIINSNLTNNSASSNNGGGAFFKENEGTVINSTFTSNSADKGAGVYIKGNGTIINSTFTNNQASKNGGAVYIIGEATVTNTTFTSNSAKKQGGAIYLEARGNISSSTFNGNEATTGTSIYTVGSSVIANSTFTDAENSTVIYSDNALSLSGNTINNNNYVESKSISSKTTITLSDVICYINCNVTITGSIIDENNNMVKISGIVITLNGNNLTTSINDDGSFYSSYSTNSSDAGSNVISATGYENTLTNTTLNNATLTVYKFSPTIEIEVNSTTYPNDVKIVVKSDVDGNYTYTTGNNSGNITLENGTGTVTLSKLKIGDYTLSINFEGNENYTNESANETFKIIAPIQKNTNVNMFYLDGSTYKVLVYGSDGNVVGAGVSVKFKINGKTYTRKTNAKGYATLKLNIKTLVPKKYTITATYNGYTVKNTVKVKQIIKAKKTTNVKKTAKTLKIKITLKGKTLLKKKTLKVKFKGKTYKIKTNKKGVAYFKLTKKVIKKLKKGKKYSYTITYQKDKIKRYIKVKK